MKARISMALAGALLFGCGGDTPNGDPSAEADLGLDGKADTTTAPRLTLPPRETLARFLARGVEFFPPQSATRAVATFYTQDRISPSTLLAVWGVDVTNRKVVFQIVVTQVELTRTLGLIASEVVRKQAPVATTGPGGSIIEGISAGSAGQVKGPPPPPPPVGDELFASRLVTAGQRVISAEQALLGGTPTATGGP